MWFHAQLAQKILNGIYPLYTLISNHRRLVSLHYDLHFYLSLVSCFPNLHRIVSQHYSGFDLHFCLSLAFGAVVFVVVVKVIVNSNGQFLAEYQSKYGYGILIVADMLIKFSIVYRDSPFSEVSIGAVPGLVRFFPQKIKKISTLQKKKNCIFFQHCCNRLCTGEAQDLHLSLFSLNSAQDQKNFVKMPVVLLKVAVIWSTFQ